MCPGGVSEGHRRGITRVSPRTVMQAFRSAARTTVRAYPSPKPHILHILFGFGHNTGRSSLKGGASANLPVRCTLVDRPLSTRGDATFQQGAGAIRMDARVQTRTARFNGHLKFNAGSWVLSMAGSVGDPPSRQAWCKPITKPHQMRGLTNGVAAFLLVRHTQAHGLISGHHGALARGHALAQRT